MHYFAGENTVVLKFEAKYLEEVINKKREVFNHINH
jgi:hypothetical protein